MNWFAVYTNPRSEKKAHAFLVEKGIEVYLPLQRTMKQWSDRKKWVEEPLFRSYLFVNIPKNQYFEVLNTPHVVRYVTFEGKAVPIPPRQIDAIRYYLSETETMPEEQDLQNLKPGASVEVIRGPLRGLTGHLIEFQGRRKVRIEIEALGQFLYLNISSNDLKPAR